MKHGEVSLIDKLIILCVSTLIGLLTYYTAVALLKKDYEGALYAQVVSGFAQIDEISDEVLTTLNGLNQQGFNECNDETLHYMRQVIFLSKFIKDIGYLDGNRLVCSTGLGRLKTPVYNPKPDYTSHRQAKVWVNTPIILTDLAVYAIVIQVGNFNAVIHRDFLDTLVNNKNDWQLFFNNPNGEVMPIAGNHDVLHDPKSIEWHQSSDFFLQECSSKIPYCLVVSASGETFRDYYHLVLVGWQIISVLAFVFCWLVGSYFMRHYRSIRARITRGLNQGAFFCQYQPIVEIQSGRIVGCEVLARYKDSKGPLYPDEFIPLIASQRNTWLFTRQIIRQALSDIDQQGSLPEGFKINFNFYPQDIESGAILELINNTDLQRSSLRFVIEVTENEKLTSAAAGRILATLADSGFEIAIDDFGTGYSNLRQIQEYQCHTLKIDRSFVSEMEAGAIRSTLIPHIVDIARKIDAQVVAEGIENNMQNQELISAGVVYGQGYMFGKPMPLDKLVAMLPKT